MCLLYTSICTPIVMYVNVYVCTFDTCTFPHGYIFAHVYVHVGDLCSVIRIIRLWAIFLRSLLK